MNKALRNIGAKEIISPYPLGYRNYGYKIDRRYISNPNPLPEYTDSIHSYQSLWNSINAKWKRVYNKKLKIYEFWQFPWAEEDAVPIPKTTQHPERYHCIPNPFVFVYSFKKAEK